MPIKVWFNRGLSSVFNALRLIRQGDGAGEYRLVCTHLNPRFAGFLEADESAVEPPGLSGTAYVDYCLNFCQENGIGVFFPGKEVTSISRSLARFQDTGTTVACVTTGDRLDLINDKAAFYADIVSSTEQVASLPDTEVVNTLAAFNAAYESLREYHEVVCIKPAISVFGLGFKIIDEAGSRFQRLVNGHDYRIGLDELRECLAEQETFRDLLVMEHLGGVEFSVDCLADHSGLLYAIMRKKSHRPGAGQLIDDNREIWAVVSNLVPRYALHGMFNVQFKQGRDGLKLLEINARMSGGIGMACLSGVNLPYLALRSITHGLTEADRIVPNQGIQVAMLEMPLLLPVT